MLDKGEKELLIRIDERVEQIDKWCYNHDAHHRKYNYLAWTTCIGLIITLIVLLIKLA